MIVIASHNNIELLSSLLFQLSQIDLKGHRICVVDTNSDVGAYQWTLSKLKYACRDIFFETKNYSCWDTGAYLHAYKTYRADKFIFLQDSLSITNPDIISEIDDLLDEYDVVPMFNFKYAYDNPEQKRWVEHGLHFSSLPRDGVFGPIFAATKSVLDRIPPDWHKEPTNKNEACGMERRWALEFHILGASMHFLEYIPHNRWGDFWTGHSDFSHNIKKTWPGRA